MKNVIHLIVLQKLVESWEKLILPGNNLPSVESVFSEDE